MYKTEYLLRDLYPEKVIIPLLVDMTNLKVLTRLYARYKPNVIIHAAAYKHVPLLESQPYAACVNNILGTHHLLKLSHQYGVERFVLVSTDKAVEPTNVMGCTKRVCELLTCYYSGHYGLETVVVRFGNVLGSAGSVVPLFHEQIKRGGPVTVTDPQMTRYFMSIPEAVNLILLSMSLGKKGHIHVLDMGEPLSIAYLAEKMISLSGLRLGEDIEIQYVGLRPGEKLYESLRYPHEKRAEPVAEKILCLESSESFCQFREQFDTFLSLLSEPGADIGQALNDLIQRDIKLPAAMV